MSTLQKLRMNEISKVYRCLYISKKTIYITACTDFDHDTGKFTKNAMLKCSQCLLSKNVYFPP